MSTELIFKSLVRFGKDVVIIFGQIDQITLDSKKNIGIETFRISNYNINKHLI